MRLTTIRRHLKDSNISEEGIKSIYLYMYGISDNTALTDPLCQRRWVLACRRAYAMDRDQRSKPLSEEEVQSMLGQKVVRRQEEQKVS